MSWRLDSAEADRSSACSRPLKASVNSGLPIRGGHHSQIDPYSSAGPVVDGVLHTRLEASTVGAPPGRVEPEYGHIDEAELPGCCHVGATEVLAALQSLAEPVLKGYSSWARIDEPYSKSISGGLGRVNQTASCPRGDPFGWVETLPWNCRRNLALRPTCADLAAHRSPR